MEVETPTRDDGWEFILACRRDDGGYNPSPDHDYHGNSDTRLSDIAAPVYAAVIARTIGYELPEAQATAEFIHRRQRPDGSYAHVTGAMDPESDLAILYNTTQAAVGLRALGDRPRTPPESMMGRFFVGDAYRRLPWYTTSFFPLFYGALGLPFPSAYRDALADHMIANQAEDGYLGDHVAATFHMAHFFRLLGEPTPRAEKMVERTLRDQTEAGGWDIREPDWDVHSCFDAVFILRQLGGGDPRCEQAIQLTADWALSCRNPNGGFGHFPGWHSDLDACYFQLGTIYQAGRIANLPPPPPDAHLLGWGHAMPPPACA